MKQGRYARANNGQLMTSFSGMDYFVGGVCAGVFIGNSLIMFILNCKIARLPMNILKK